MNTCIYIRIYLHSSSSGPPVGAIECGAGCPLYPRQNRLTSIIETPRFGSIERVLSVSDILPNYFRLANSAARRCNSIPHSTPQHNTRPSFLRPTQLRPNCPVASAHISASQVHSAATESFALTRSSRDYPLSCLYVLLQDYFAFLDNMYSNTVRTAMHHLRPLARKPTYISSIEDESGWRASPAMLL